MTCIVGIEHEGTIFMGGDSAGISGLSVTIRNDKKVFSNGPFLMGFTTSFRMGQLLQYDFSPPTHPENKSDMAYMVTDFTNAVRKTFSSAGYLAKNSNSQETGGAWLVGYNKKLYKIDHDFQIGISASGYQSVGCGCDLALGALYATKDVIEDPKERILIALKAAAQFSGGVRAPFTILPQ